MKILHTSDWHIGRRLHEHERLDEMQKFFSWLENLIAREKIDTLLIAGDVFDNTTPSNQAKEIYYHFLSDVAKSCCRHVIIISGNHDSPAFLDAPSKVLGLLNIHVIGQACKDPKDEILLLKNTDEKPEAIVCAVPFLHDRDIRTVSAEDDFQDRQRALINGIYEHYAKVFAEARKLNVNLLVPIIAMGHLFVAGGKVIDGEEMRELYVGTLVRVGKDIFPEDINYAALGHLHSAQGNNRIRYSGSPVAMNFMEAKTPKSVCIVEFDENNKATTRTVPVPVFQQLERIKGDWPEIEAKIKGYIDTGEELWIEITYTGEEIFDIKERAERLLKNQRGQAYIEILSIHNETGKKLIEISGGADCGSLRLGDISPLEVFERRLEASKTSEEDRKILRILYQKILEEIINNEDT